MIEGEKIVYQVISKSEGRISEYQGGRIVRSVQRSWISISPVKDSGQHSLIYIRECK